MDLNVRSFGKFSQYSDQIPAFLQNRPKGVVTHVMENLRGPDERAAKRVKKEDDGEFMVDGKIRVQFGDDLTYPHCTCSEWRHSRLPCKHFCLIFANIPGCGWEKLSSLYRESPLLNLDYDILAVNNNQAPTNDWVDTPDCSDTQETASKSSQDQLETIPLPARRQSKLE